MNVLNFNSHCLGLAYVNFKNDYSFNQNSTASDDIENILQAVVMTIQTPYGAFAVDVTFVLVLSMNEVPVV